MTACAVPWLEKVPSFDRSLPDSPYRPNLKTQGRFNEHRGMPTSVAASLKRRLDTRDVGVRFDCFTVRIGTAIMLLEIPHSAIQDLGLTPQFDNSSSAFHRDVPGIEPCLCL